MKLADWAKRQLTDKQLMKLCSQFRYGVIGRGKSRDRCYVISAPLHAYLKFLKVDCELIEGFVTINQNITSHYWIALPDGRIIDPTADQFNEIRGCEMPKVFIGEKPHWYMLRKKKKI